MSRIVVSVRERRLEVVRDYMQQLTNDLLRMQRSLGVEVIHDVRVNARRLRVMLKVLQTECQPLLLRTLLFDLRDIGRALTLVREADVRRQGLTPLLNRVRRTNLVAVEKAAVQLRMDCQQGRQSLKSLIRATNWQTRLQRLSDEVDNDGLLALPRPGQCFDLEHAALDFRLREIRKRLKSRGGIKRKELHILRIKVKKARYVGDFINDVDSTMSPELLENLKHLQTRLGKLHDGLQLQHWLGETAGLDPSLSEQLHQILRLSVAARHQELLVWCQNKFA